MSSKRRITRSQKKAAVQEHASRQHVSLEPDTSSGRPCSLTNVDLFASANVREDPLGHSSPPTNSGQRGAPASPGQPATPRVREGDDDHTNDGPNIGTRETVTVSLKLKFEPGDTGKHASGVLALFAGALHGFSGGLGAYR
jgi:hypothetical protein